MLSKLRSNETAMRKQLRNLTTGKRLNEAADDVARAQQVTHLEAQVRGNYRAARNAYEGIQLARTGDAALAEVNHLLLEMRSLAVRSASDTHTDSDRVSYNDSFSHFNREIQTIADRTEIFGIGIFQSEGLGKQLQIEMEPFRPLMLQLKTFGTQQIARYASRETERVSQQGLLSGELFINDVRIRGTLDSDDRLSTSEQSASAISKAAAINDATQHSGVSARVLKTVRNGHSTPQGGRLEIGDEVIINGVAFTGIEVGLQRNDDFLINVNAEAHRTGVIASKDPHGALVLTADDGRNIEVITKGNAHLITGLGNAAGGDLTTGKLMISSPETIFFDSAPLGDGESKIGVVSKDIVGKSERESVASLDVKTRRSSELSIEVIDRAVEDLVALRSYFGGLENRLGSSVHRLNSASQNAYVAKGRMEDTDYSQESIVLARSQTLRSAYTAMIKKSNQLPSRVLDLL